MGTTAEKLTYLNTTKGKIKDSINLTGAGITSSDTFRSYATKLKQGLINALNDNGETIISNFPKVSGTGSILSLTPTYEAPMGISVYGDTYQNGTPAPDTPVEIQSATGLQNINVCGKNLCFNITKPSNANLKFFINKSISKTFTISFTTNEALNGNSLYLEVDGTRYENIGSITASANTKVEKTYTLSDTNYQTIENGTNIDLLLYKNGANFNIPNDGMVENNSTATTYEPYTGNTYEVNLGKNLLPNLGTSQIINGVAFTKNEDGSVLVNGTSTDTIFYDIIPANSYPINTNNTFLSGCPADGSTTSYELRVVYTNNTNDRDVGSGIALANKTLKQVMIRLQSGMTFNNLLFKPMIEKGTQATSYSPYFTPIELNKIGDYEDSIKKSTGKNLFDINGTFTGNLIKYNNGFQLIKNSTNRTINYLPSSPIPKGTYTLSYEIVSSTLSDANKLLIQFFNVNNTNILTKALSSTGSLNCILTEDVVKIYFYISNTEETDTQITLDNIQLEQNNQATEYEPYGKVWYITKNTGKVVLNGSENGWTYNDTNQVFVVPDLVNYLRSEFVPYSNYYQGQSVTLYNQVENNHIAFLQSTTQNRLLIKNLNYTGVSAFKTWLSSNNVSVIYILNTPTYTTITNEELIKELESIKSKNGTTNISVSSEYLPAILGCSALKVEE